MATTPQRRRTAFALLSLPVIFFVLVFFGWPILKIVWLSVTEPRPGLGNYARLASSSAIHMMLWTTLRISVITSAFTIVLTYVVSYSLAGMAGRRAEVMTALLLLPLWSSVVAQAFGWLLILRSNGLINTALLDLGLISAPLELVRNELGVIIGMVSFMLPVGVMVLLPNLREINPELVLAAKTLGASPAQAFWDVYFPEAIPGTIGATAIIFILALGFFGIPTILGGGKTIMVAEYVSVQVLQTARWGVASMLAMVLLAAICLILLTISRFVDLRRVLVGG